MIDPCIVIFSANHESKTDLTSENQLQLRPRCRILSIYISNKEIKKFRTIYVSMLGPKNGLDGMSSVTVVPSVTQSWQ